MVRDHGPSVLGRLVGRCFVPPAALSIQRVGEVDALAVEKASHKDVLPPIAAAVQKGIETLPPKQVDSRSVQRVAGTPQRENLAFFVALGQTNQQRPRTGRKAVGAILPQLALPGQALGLGNKGLLNLVLRYPFSSRKMPGPSRKEQILLGVLLLSAGVVVEVVFASS